MLWWLNFFIQRVASPLPSAHAEKKKQWPLQFYHCILTSLQYLLYFLQSNNYSKRLIFKNKDYTLRRIFLSTLLYITKCFLHFCPGIWPPWFPCHKLFSLFSDHRHTWASGLQMLMQEICSCNFSGASGIEQVFIYSYVYKYFCLFFRELSCVCLKFSRQT